MYVLYSCALLLSLTGMPGLHEDCATCCEFSSLLLRVTLRSQPTNTLLSQTLKLDTLPWLRTRRELYMEHLIHSAFLLFIDAHPL